MISAVVANSAPRKIRDERTIESPPPTILQPAPKSVTALGSDPNVRFRTWGLTPIKVRELIVGVMGGDEETATFEDRLGTQVGTIARSKCRRRNEFDG
jgi:hypothetical protein